MVYLSPEPEDTSKPPMQLWELPTDIIYTVLENVSFMDYVNLMFTCKTLHELLDKRRVFELVWKRNFGARKRLYEWPISDERLMKGGWRQLYTSINRLERQLSRYDSMLDFAKRTNEEKLARFTSQVLLQALWKIVANDRGYLCAIMHFEDTEWDKFCKATEEKRESYNIFRVCLSKKLLYQQNFNFAMEFFLRSKKFYHRDLEKCLFEMSRFDFNFEELAQIRQDKLATMRRLIRENVGQKDAVVECQSVEEFHDLMFKLAHYVLQDISETDHTYVSTNVLREYSGQQRRPKLYRLAILAKLIEEFFTNTVVNFQGTRYRHEIRMSTAELVTGSFRYKLNDDFNGIELIEDDEEPKRPVLNYGSAIYHSLPAGHFVPPGIWQFENMCYSEDREFWEVMRYLALELLKKPEFPRRAFARGNPILHSVTKDLRPTAIMSYTAGKALEGSPSLRVEHLPDNAFPLNGKIAILKHGSIRVMHGAKEDYSGRPYFYLLDKSEVDKCGKAHTFPKIDKPEMVQWILKCRGFSSMGVFDFPELKYEDGLFRFAAGKYLDEKYDARYKKLQELAAEKSQEKDDSNIETSA